MRRVYYASADLLTLQEPAQQAGRVTLLARALVSQGLMVVDEVECLPISRAGTWLFFQTISRRHVTA